MYLSGSIYYWCEYMLDLFRLFRYMYLCIYPVVRGTYLVSSDLHCPKRVVYYLLPKGHIQIVVMSGPDLAKPVIFMSVMPVMSVIPT